MKHFGRGHMAVGGGAGIPGHISQVPWSLPPSLLGTFRWSTGNQCTVVEQPGDLGTGPGLRSSDVTFGVLFNIPGPSLLNEEPDGMTSL